MTQICKNPLSLFGISLALLVALVWGINFVVAKVGLSHVPPLTFCALRFFLVCIPAIFFVSKPNAPWKYVIAYGLLIFALQFALVFSGIAFGVTPGIAALILQLGVFFAIFFAYLLLGEKIQSWQIVGALIALSGILVIAFFRDGTCTLSGFLLVLGAAISWGLGSIVSTQLKSVNTLSLVIWGSLIAFVPLTIFAFILEDPLPILLHPEAMSVGSIWAFFYTAYMSTIVGYGIWSWLLNRYSVASIAPFILLCPIITLFFSALLLGESLDVWKMIASVLVILGLCINTFGSYLFQIKKWALLWDYGS